MHINDVYAIRGILKDLHFTPLKDVKRVEAAIEALDEEINAWEQWVLENEPKGEQPDLPGFEMRT